MLRLTTCLLFSCCLLAKAAPAVEQPLNLDSYSLWAESPAPMPLPQGWRNLPAPPSSHALIEPPKNEKDHRGVFVRLQLNIKPNSNLKDSLSDLNQKAGFHPDRRFAPVFKGEKEQAFVWGWLPSNGIGQAARVPAVEKISFSKNKVIDHQQRQQEGLIIGLRVDSSISKTLSQDLPALIRKTGLKIEKTIGYQPVPQSDQIAIIFLGKISISNIGILLDQPEVIKVLPLLKVAGNSKSSFFQTTPPASTNQGHPLLIGMTLGLVIGGAAGIFGQFAKRKT